MQQHDTAYQPVQMDAPRGSHGSDTTLTPPNNANIESQPNNPTKESDGMIPRINYSLRERKVGIIITWSVLLISSLLCPTLVFYGLHYLTSASVSTQIAIPTAIFGAPTLFSLSMRSYQLLKVNSTCRPIGAKRWQLDFFHWNFLVGFIAVTIIIIIGNVVPDIRVAALGLPFLIAEVSLQILIGAVLQTFNFNCPVTVSSVHRGDKIRGGCYSLAEDICAVDCAAGVAFREQIWARWDASPDIRRMLLVLDWAWGVGGIAVGVACFVTMFAINSDVAGWTIGWAGPWAFAIVGGLCTFFYVRRTLKLERQKELAGRV